jgi:hypothetical protein
VTEPPSSEIAPPKPTMRGRMAELLAEYGKLALVLYLIIFALVFTGFLVALAAGVRVESAAGSAGLVGGAWLATKLTQPVRILAALALTPLVARALGWARARRPE